MQSPRLVTTKPLQSPGLIRLPRWCSGKDCTCHFRRNKRHSFNSWVWKIPWSTDWQPSPVFLPGQRSLVGYNPWGHKELGTAKASTCNVGDPGSIPELGRSPGEGNGNPLQYPCLESPMDGGAWEAAVHGVAKSQTGLSDFTFLS